LCGKLRFNSRIQGGERGSLTSRRRSYTRRTRPSCILHGHHLAAHCVALCKGAVAELQRGKEAAYHQRAETTSGTFVAVIHQPEKEETLRRKQLPSFFIFARINADLKVALREFYISLHQVIIAYIYADMLIYTYIYVVDFNRISFT